MQQNQYIFLRSDMSVYTYFYFAVILKKIFDDQRIKLVLKDSFESNVNMLMLWSLTPPPLSPFLSFHYRYFQQYEWLMIWLFELPKYVS